MEEIIDFVNFEIQNSGYADKLAAGVVITGGGAMLRHLPQLMKFKTAMDVRIGYPNEHLSGTSKTEINQPMYATSVGLIMKGFDYLETYRQPFNAGTPEEYRQPVHKPAYEEPVAEQEAEAEDFRDEEAESYSRAGKTSITEKIKAMMRNMFEVEDQTIS
jgi:cell division protein FtsA